VPTLREVAQHAGVSYTQASYVLNGRNLNCVSPDRRARIQSAMRELGYRPHAAARTTRSGRFGAVSLVLGTKDGRSTLPMSMLNGIQDALAEHDLNLMVVRLPDERLTDSDYIPRILRETSSDGLLIDYTHDIPDRMLDLIRQVGIPAVWINSKQNADCVYPDEFAAARNATQRLVAAGHRSIAYADFAHGPDFPSPHFSVGDRMDGYVRAMLDAGLKPVVYRAASGFDVSGGERLRFAARVMRTPDRPSAVICYGATTAAPFVKAAADHGVQVHADLAVLSFDDPPAVMVIPQPITLHIPNAEVGRRAVEMLIRKTRSPRVLCEPIALPYAEPSFATAHVAPPPPHAP
jgi:LacI family transcriptional regulator